ncbi:C45 family autoproteolytic acyltransferase/hydrolase [SAR92 clade bacterium H246]
MNTLDMPVIELSGTAKQRGQCYGETVRDLIAANLDSWRADLGNFCQKKQGSAALDSKAYLDTFFSQTDYLSAIKRWAPQLLDEVKGIAEGANQSLQNILGLNLFDEEWVFGLTQGQAKSTTKCTAFAVSDEKHGTHYAGQTMDIPSWVEGRQVLLRTLATETQPEALIFSVAGCLGLNGINANGVGITCNTLAQLPYARDGLPVMFVLRSVLEKKNMHEAEALIHSIKHASGQNYIISSADDRRCFECGSTGVSRYQPGQAKTRVFHSNHPLVNQARSDVAVYTEARFTNSKARLDSICTRLGDPQQPLNIQTVKTALAAHDDPQNPVSRTLNKHNKKDTIGYTAGASIYEWVNGPRLHLAAGPACETPFELFTFTKSGTRDEQPSTK